VESTLSFSGLESCPDIDGDAIDILYRMSGYVHKLRKRVKCVQCWESLLHQEVVPHPYAGLVIETGTKSEAQVRVGNPLFLLFLAGERLLVASIPLLPQMRLWGKVALTKHIHSELKNFKLPTCHDVRSVLIGRYLPMRIAQLSRYLTIRVGEIDYCLNRKSIISGRSLEKS